MSQRDRTQDSEQIYRICDCGWSKVATYADLKIHQVETGCTPSLNVNQQNLSQNVGLTNNQEDLLVGVSTLWDSSSSAMSQRDSTQDFDLTLRSHQTDLGCRPRSKVRLQNLSENLGLTNNQEDLFPGVSTLRADSFSATPQRDPTQDLDLTFRFGAWSNQSEQQNLSKNVGFTNNQEDLLPGVSTLGDASFSPMSQRDPTQDLELIPRACYCGWSKVATYHDLKSHQADKGCTPKSKVKQTEQQNLSENVGLTNNQDDIRADMTSAQASPGEALSLEQQLTCPICMNLFLDPVTTACGHSFCKGCLDYNFQSNDRQCPLCKQILRRSPEVSIVLRSIAEQMKKIPPKVEDQPSLAPGEVACDICAEPKLKAEKSCLVCLASYCLTHLQNHSSTKRLKGHKLVEPVEDLDARACLQHGRPLELYSRKTGKCICARCLEEGQEEVVSTEEECDTKKAKIQNTKADLQEQIKKRKRRVVEINKELKSCKDHLDNEWWDIDAVFTTVINIMEEAHASALKPLKERREVLEKDAEDIKDKLEAEIDRLEKTISELDDISALEDHVLFLQRYPSLRDPDDHKDSTKVELDTSLTFGTMRKTTTAMLERIQLELETLASTELQRIPKFTVDVKLDPTTAHRRLILSDDGKEVTDGGVDQEVDDSPERFDFFASILGINQLTTGKSYWEVEVSNKMGWDLGVTTGDANRKGKLTLNPDNGYWVTVHYEEENYAAMTAPPVRLPLKKKPQKVGVFVDYEEGLVSFYNVTAQSHIFSFTGCSFGDDLFPYFSPHAKKDVDNSDPLIITAVKHGERDMDIS
ncbi:E3 ubiquitin-protein ligase TRIM38-like isoform X2 [Centropristis striata]|uniref:E3 ubiquitin-protein ligase TRIM38-like isoform X2 n=1 Tax=Centropristis striata TaxID=184440 RepID=UPI0027E050E0|nr:E3 ubiquitin-protein ligase TRIM38-like isoform X2 [Centropristis striata]